MGDYTISYTGMVALLWTFTSVSTILVALRIFTRIKVRALGLEDYIMAAAWCCLLSGSILSQINEYQTSFTNKWKTSPIQINAIASAFPALYLTTGYLGKLSIGLLLLRLLGLALKHRRLIIIISLIALTLAFVPGMIAAIFPFCEHPEYSPWPGPACITMTSNEVLVALWSIVSTLVDILFSAIPCTFVHRLKMSRAKKTWTIVVLGLGWIASVFSILRLPSVFPSTYGDMSAFGAVIGAVAFRVETNLVVICGCVPTLGPLLEYWRSGRPLNPKKRLTRDQE